MGVSPGGGLQTGIARAAGETPGVIRPHGPDLTRDGAVFLGRKVSWGHRGSRGLQVCMTSGVSRPLAAMPG